MNYENVDTEPSLKMHKLPSVLFFCVCVWGGGGGGRQGTFFWSERGGRVHSAQGTTQFVPIN